VLITDVTDEILRTEIAKLVGIPYLERATQEEANKKRDVHHGFLFGDNYRPIFPCIVSNEDSDKAHWVFFIVDTGSPKTYVAAKTAEILGIQDMPSPNIKIAGYHKEVRPSPSGSHFTDLNLLGSDYCANYNIALGYKGRGRTMDIIFGWDKKLEFISKL
jgi:hypothetical protein